VLAEHLFGLVHPNIFFLKNYMKVREISFMIMLTRVNSNLEHRV